MDSVDRKIFSILQKDASLTVADIGRAVGLSVTPCWKRIQRLESSGIIRKRVALVAPDKVGFGVTAQVNIQTGDHAPAALEAFIATVRAMLQRLAGEVDFSLRVIAVDVRHYEEIHRRLTAAIPLRRVTSYFLLEQLKSETALPLAPWLPNPIPSLRPSNTGS
jgi:Lrp/AsnC family transcriptional regulator